MKSNTPKTIFCDLDGTLTKHPADATVIQDPNYELEVLPGTKEIMNDWDRKRYYIVKFQDLDDVQDGRIGV